MGRVVGELGDWEPGCPVRVQGFDVGTEDLLDGTMSNLRLAIGLWVMGGGEVEGGTEAAEKGLPELCGDACVTVGDDEFGEALEAVNVLQVEVGETCGGNRLGGPYEEGLLGEQVNEGGNGVVRLTVMGGGGRKVCDEVHGDVGPRARGDSVRLKEPGGDGGGGLDALAGGAGCNVLPYGLGEPGPPVVLRNRCERAEVPWVT